MRSITKIFSSELGRTFIIATPLDVTVSIPPQKYFVERVGGDHVNVNVIMPNNSNPLTYKPDDEMLLSIGQTSAYFTIGMPFEEAFLKDIIVSYPELKIVDTAERVSRFSVYDHFKVALAGFPETISASDIDPHIWMSPTMAKSQAEVILDALTELDPKREEDFKANYRSFTADIDTLFEEAVDQLTTRQISKFMLLHPSMGYYGDEYKLEMLPIQIGTRKPNQAEIVELIILARKEKINTIFAQPQFDTNSASIIANEIGVELIMFDPLSEDWLENQYYITNSMAESIQ